ncbi:MAG TPA: RNA polymerase sigma factor [Candidatus Eisenbacteria bacterium]
MSRAEERRLLALAKRGDQRALQSLLTALSQPIYRFGLGFCRDSHDAEDLAQDVLLALSRSLSGVRGDAALTTYAYAAARNACLRRRRRPAGAPERLESLDARLSRGDGGEPADPALDPHRRLERLELSDAVRRAIAELPPVQREAVLLRDVEGLTAREAASALGVDVSAVKARLHRGRLALRRALLPFVSPGEASAPRARGCPETARYFSRFLEGELTPAVCARLQTHVEACLRCARVCRSMRETLGACRRLKRAPAPRARRALRATIREAAGTRRGAKA